MQTFNYIPIQLTDISLIEDDTTIRAKEVLGDPSKSSSDEWEEEDEDEEQDIYCDDVSIDRDDPGLGDSLASESDHGDNFTPEKSLPKKEPVDISQTRDDSPVQPRLPVWPKHKIGSVYRYFNEALYGRYKWLEYSIEKDAVFCLYCRHAAGQRAI